MAEVDLVCRDCKHAFRVVTRTSGGVKERQKQCPACGSRAVRQTMASYLRNGPLSSPDCGAPRTSYG